MKQRKTSDTGSFLSPLCAGMAFVVLMVVILDWRAGARRAKAQTPTLPRQSQTDTTGEDALPRADASLFPSRHSFAQWGLRRVTYGPAPGHWPDTNAPQAPADEDEPDALEQSRAARGELRIDFQGLPEPPEGYILENLELDDGGLRISSVPADPSSDAYKPRVGTIESPPLVMDCASGVFFPRWREILPDNTAFTMEIAVSNDGKHWSDWEWIDSRLPESSATTEIPPPDAGADDAASQWTRGDAIVWTRTEWRYIRFRATLVSLSSESPLISGLSIAYHSE